MSLWDEAKNNPDTPLVELNSFAEVDIQLIIKAYEEALYENGTEESIIVSQYGELEKQDSVLSIMSSVVGSYGPKKDEDDNIIATSSWSNSWDTFGINELQKKWPKFAECFPCDGRISLSIDNLPPLEQFNIWESILAVIEDFQDKLKLLMNPLNFYKDACALINAFRLVCPQDLIILLSLLTFLLQHYTRLSLKLNIDWVSLLGMLLMPILMIIQALLQIAVNIGLGPLRCLINLLTFVYELGRGIDFAATGTADVSADIDVNFLSENSSAGFEFNKNYTLGTTGYVQIPPVGGYRKYQEYLGKLSAFESLMVGMVDIQETLEGLLAKFSITLEGITRLMNAGMLLRMQFAANIIDILRLIKFVNAVLKALSDNSICSDPAEKLSGKDVEAVLKAFVNQIDPATGLARDNTNSSSVVLDFDTATGDLVITDNINDQSKAVPLCISKSNATDQEKILSWIEELEANS